MPLSVAVCGVFAALSATETVAEKLAAVAGVKVKEMLQLRPQQRSAAGSDFRKVRRVRSGERNASDVERGITGVRQDDRLRGRAAPTVVLGKAMLVGLSTACGTKGAVPVPLSIAVCGVFAALSATETEAEKLAALAGVKVTEMLQLAPAARVPLQDVVSVKSEGLAPVTVMPVTLSVALPGFDSVIDCAVAVAPTVVLGKAILLGLSTA